MSYLAIDNNLKTFESGEFEGMSQLELLGQILIELRVISHFLSESAEVGDSVEAVREDEIGDLKWR